MCLQASHRATLVRSGSCSLGSWMRRFWRWAGTFAGRSAERLRGTISLCVVSAGVGHLEGRQLRGALVYCLDVDLTISVLLPVGSLFHDVTLDVEGKAADGFPE